MRGWFAIRQSLCRCPLHVSEGDDFRVDNVTTRRRSQREQICERRRLSGASRGDGTIGARTAGGRQRGASGGDGISFRVTKSRRSANESRADSIVSDATRGSSQRGYTLIEVLVAFAVLALALTLLLGTLSGATRQVRWSADAGRAALHARSLLAQTGVGEVLQPGRREGVFEEGRYRWTMEVAPYADPLRPPAALDPFSAQLMQLRLAVTWGDGTAARRIELDSLRLVQPDPAQVAFP